MNQPHNLAKRWIAFWLCMLPFVALAEQGVVVVGSLNEPLPLGSHFALLEDPGDQFVPDELFTSPEYFSPITHFKYLQADDVFWLRTSLNTQEAHDAVLSFDNLTHVDLYIYADSLLAQHRQAGAFRPHNEINAHDTRFSFDVSLRPHIAYTLLIKVQHVKNYPPDFNFLLSTKSAFLKERHQKELTDRWLLGSISILFAYSCLSWLATRFKPYIWLTLFIAGIGLYDLSLNRYLIDWFFPGRPETGWLLIVHFLHLGIAGLYLLLMDFWKLKERKPFLFRWGKLML